MKNAELHDELDRLAGPPPPATTAGLRTVRRRTLFARVRNWTLATVAVAALVVASMALVRGDAGPNRRVETPASPSTSVTSTPRVAQPGTGQIPDDPVATCVSAEQASGIVSNGTISVYDRGVHAPIQMGITTYCEGIAAVQRAAGPAGQADLSIYVENGQVRGEHVAANRTP